MVKACNIDNFRLTQNCVAFDSNWQEKIRHLFKMHSFHLFCNAEEFSDKNYLYFFPHNSDNILQFSYKVLRNVIKYIWEFLEYLVTPLRFLKHFITSKIQALQCGLSRKPVNDVSEVKSLLMILGLKDQHFIEIRPDLYLNDLMEVMTK